MTRKVLIAAVLLVLAFAGSAHAATWTVASTADDTGTCDATTHVCATLRAAVHQANALKNADTIVLGAETYTLQLAPTSSEPDDSGGDLNIEFPLTIQGAGAGSTTVDGAGVDRVFDVQSTSTTVGVVFSDLTITGGNSLQSTPGGGLGGGIAVPSTSNAPVTIQNTVLTANTSNVSGGGVSVEGGGTIVINNSRLTGNQANADGGGAGGGIYYNPTGGSLTVENTAIAGNHAPASSGGGIWMDAVGAPTAIPVTITGSTISGNDAGRNDGGILAHADTTTITNSTISGNTADQGPGGMQADFGTVTLLNDTIAFNQTRIGAGGLVDASPATVNVKNTIVSNNTGGNSGDCDPASPPTSQGHNIAGDSSCATFIATGDRQSTNPQLGPLADNGGPTQTHALPLSSPAIDSGDNSGCPANDQRGVARPFDANFDGLAICDIGAFELSAASPTVVTGPSGGVTTSGATLSGSVNPNGVPANQHFEFGTTPAYGSSTPVVPVPAGSAPQPASATITGLAPNTLYHYRLVGSGPGGTTPGADAVLTTASSPFTFPLPPPVEGVSANLIPVSGTVLVAQPLTGNARRAAGAATKGALPGFGPFVKLTQPAQVRFGTLVNTNAGVVQLFSAVNHAGATQSGQFSKGLFIIQQSKTNPLTTASMAGGNLSSCSKLPRGGAAKLIAARRGRSLFANVHGRFRTRGRNSTATVRGTAFLVKDTCASTLTSVSRGVVSVHDFTLRKTVKVKAHHKYLARAPKRRGH